MTLKRAECKHQFRLYDGKTCVGELTITIDEYGIASSMECIGKNGKELNQSESAMLVLDMLNAATN